MCLRLVQDALDVGAERQGSLWLGRIDVLFLPGKQGVVALTIEVSLDVHVTARVALLGGRGPSSAAVAN
eukprot:scaffold275_cov301-Prasinococcus_capsulatus_cf.AAC.6